jgi:hypothetical protein
LPLPRQSSSLFANVPAASAPAAPPAGESVARTLFQSATGLFRKRAIAAPVPEPIVRRREPMAIEAGQMASAGELVMEAERPPVRSAALDSGELDIPAFLRRQSS